MFDEIPEEVRMRQTSPTVVHRDYATEMLDRINSAFAAASEPVSAMVVAKRIVAQLEDTDPDLLQGWLRLNAEDLLRRYAGLVQSSERSHNRAVSGRRAFADAREAHEAGDSEPLQKHTTWLSSMFVVDDRYSRLALGDCTATELRYVSSRYEHTARSASFEAVFFGQLAEKVGDQKVSEVYTEDEIAAFRNTIDSMFNG
jgi:hypothetical protein